MAGFNLETQKAAGMYGARVEFGTYSFVTSGVVVELPTTLTTVLAFLGIVTADEVVVTCDNVVSGSAVTVTRASGGTSATEFQYIMLGY